MSRFAALALYPLWAVAAAVGVTALRLGRASGLGLVSLCFTLSLWVTGLILLESEPSWMPIAERVLPAGILVAAGFVHAGVDATGERRPRLLAATYAASLAIAALGALAPRSFYGPGARGLGPLFLPISAVSALVSVAVFVWLLRATLRAEGLERRRRAALTVGQVLGALGGGGVVALRVLGLGDVSIAAPLLLPSVLLAAYAVLARERGRARGVLGQGLVYAVITAALSACGLTVYFAILPHLAPGAGASVGWLMFVTFFAVLPLDPARLLVVERAGRWLFKNPIGVRDLAERVEREETRADHAERLAEIGRLASAVAHEIRNPLGVIAAQAKLLERQGASAASVAALRTQVDRARHFLDDLLRYSKPRPLETAEVEVRPALETAIAQVNALLGDGAPPIALDVADLPALEVDRRAFEDVASVLVHNAAIAVASVDGARVRVRAFSVPGAVAISVEDDGPGVPKEIEATLFQPFVTGRGRDAEHPGTGLGLAIAARWVERHGGNLVHERPASGGARFVARWPLSADGA